MDEALDFMHAFSSTDYNIVEKYRVVTLDLGLKSHVLNERMTFICLIFLQNDLRLQLLS